MCLSNISCRLHDYICHYYFVLCVILAFKYLFAVVGVHFCGNLLFMGTGALLILCGLLI